MSGFAKVHIVNVTVVIQNLWQTPDGFWQHWLVIDSMCHHHILNSDKWFRTYNLIEVIYFISVTGVNEFHPVDIC